MLEPTSLNGVLLIDKPRGVISRHVTQSVVRLLPKAAVGHLGTLDPAAEGLLPILIGKATRLQNELITLKKTYRCEVSLGFETDSLDLDGSVVKEKALVPFNVSMLEKVISGLIGKSKQIPPIYSAAKVKGKALYHYARENRANDLNLELLARDIIVYDAALISFSEMKFEFQVSCSKGTYVRVLAQRLAHELNNLGTVSKLRRTTCGGYDVSQAMAFADLSSSSTQVFNNKDLGSAFVPLGEVDIALPKLQVKSSLICQKLLMGQSIPLSQESELDFSGFTNSKGDSISSGRILILDADKSALALGMLRANSNGKLAVSIFRSLR